MRIETFCITGKRYLRNQSGMCTSLWVNLLVVCGYVDTVDNFQNEQPVDNFTVYAYNGVQITSRGAMCVTINKPIPIV